MVFYVAAHIGVLYDYESHDMRFLQGHVSIKRLPYNVTANTSITISYVVFQQNAITSISVDKEGKWIVTSDSGEDNVVIVWDSENW